MASPLGDLSPAFFRELLPTLTFDEPLPLPEPQPAQPPPTFAARLSAHGFVRLPPSAVWPPEAGVPLALLQALSAGASALAQRGLPLALLSVSLEAQALARALARLLHAALGHAEHACIGDWAFFHVDAAAGGRGWPPHRDRARAAGALQPGSGEPNYITCWLPLSSATPETSCLYFVPRCRDPGYEAGDGGDDGGGEEEAEAAGAGAGADADASSAGHAPPPPPPLPPAHPLAAAFATPDCYQHIVGLPTARGGLVAFSSRALHWGSAPLPLEAEWAASEGQRAPRQALSIAYARADFERPALARGAGACEAPSFAEARALAAAQALIYHAQAPLAGSAVARALLAVVQGPGGGALEEGYRARAVRAGRWVAFSAAFAEGGDGGGGGGSGAPSAAEVALAFAGRAGVEEGFDCSSYV